MAWPSVNFKLLLDKKSYHVFAFDVSIVVRGLDTQEALLDSQIDRQDSRIFAGHDEVRQTVAVKIYKYNVDN